MKSAVFYGKRSLKVEDWPRPAPGDHDVLIKVKICGVCGTDVHIYQGDKGAAEVVPPIILGHEFSGIVVDTGKKVSKWKAGDRVCIDPNCYCGQCEACRSGMNHFCTDMICYGTTVNGGFAEYCCVDERQVYLLGDRTSFEQGAMAEPVACCLHGIDMCEISPGSHVLVIGGGMIGLLMIQLARLAGASSIALMEPVESKRKLGVRLGADFTINPQSEDVREALRRQGITSVDRVIECVGSTSTIEQAVNIAGNKSIIMAFGLTGPDAVISIRPFDLFKKEKVLKSSYINPNTQKRALELINAGRIDVTSMVCKPCGLEQLEEILRDPAIRAKGKYLISPE